MTEERLSYLSIYSTCILVLLSLTASFQNTLKRVKLHETASPKIIYGRGSIPDPADEALGASKAP